MMGAPGSLSGFGVEKSPSPLPGLMTQVLLHSRDRVKFESFESSAATGPNTLVEYIDLQQLQVFALSERDYFLHRKQEFIEHS